MGRQQSKEAKGKLWPTGRQRVPLSAAAWGSPLPCTMTAPFRQLFTRPSSLCNSLFTTSVPI